MNSFLSSLVSNLGERFKRPYADRADCGGADVRGRILEAASEAQAGVRSGSSYCVGSSIGLMVMLLALGVMSIMWMAVVAVLVVAQKLLPPTARIDGPVALAIVALGIVAAAPTT